MKILCSLMLFLSFGAQAKGYSCLIESDDVSGSLNISMKNKKAVIVLKYDGGEKTYDDCTANRDEFGLLVDCNKGERDFMVLINDELSPATGGIMSTTHELFVDLEC